MDDSDTYVGFFVSADMATTSQDSIADLGPCIIFGFSICTESAPAQFTTTALPSCFAAGRELTAATVLMQR